MTVNEALSKHYGRQVVGGFTNSGYPVVRPADDLEAVLAGGLGGEVPPAVESLLCVQAALDAEIEEFLSGIDEAAEAKERA